MLYLEDYLELIEHLPQETCDRLTDLRELDLQVQNALDNIEKRTSRFFQSAYHLQPTDLEAEHLNILKEYKKILEDSEEKVQLANSMTDSMGKYMRRLDQDLMKFKMELEADNCGITEIIEKRLEEPDEVIQTTAVSTPISQRGTRRQSYQPYDINNRHIITSQELKRQENVNSVEQKFQRMSLPNQNPSHSQVMFSVEQMGAGGSAIAAAASQAIVATQQMQQGRRTASLKASYEAINSGSGSFSRTSDISSMNRELSGAAQTAIAAVQQTHKRHRRRGRQPQHIAETVFEPVADTSDIGEDSSLADADPDEPRYCVCNQVAYGDMVACDNKNCPYEWYHYPCVGISESPKGKWYCPQCSASMRRRNRKSL